MTAVASGRVTIPAWRAVRAGWRRSRVTLTALLAVLAGAAGGTLQQGQSMRAWLAAHQCPVSPDSVTAACTPAVQGEFFEHFHASSVIFPLLAAPAVLAMFGGVRWLTREYETGAYRYTWTLGVSRLRWLAGTVLPLLAVVAAGSVACGLAFAWWLPAGQWLEPPDTPWLWNGFPLTPITFPALCIAGLGIAAAAAALIRRTVPAMAATGAVVAAAAWLADTRLRAWLLTVHPVIAPAQYLSMSGKGTVPDQYPGGFLVRGWLTDQAGHAVPGFNVTHDGALVLPPRLAALGSRSSPAGQRAWLAAHHYSYWISYQPHSRLLLFQAAWAGALLLVAAAGFALAAWRVSR